MKRIRFILLACSIFLFSQFGLLSQDLSVLKKENETLRKRVAELEGENAKLKSDLAKLAPQIRGSSREEALAKQVIGRWSEKAFGHEWIMILTKDGEVVTSSRPSTIRYTGRWHVEKGGKSIITVINLPDSKVSPTETTEFRLDTSTGRLINVGAPSSTYTRLDE